MNSPTNMRYPTPPTAGQILHPDVNVGIHRWTLDGALADVGQFGSLYEDGEMLLFDDSGLEIAEHEWRLLASINPPVVPVDDKLYKKAKLRRMLLPFAKDVPHVLDHLCGQNRKAAGRLQALISRVTQLLRARAVALFPTYKFVGEDITWRLTPTESEDIHYDSYEEHGKEFHGLRMFINLDSAPRLWGVGPKIQHSIAKYAKLLPAVEQVNPNKYNDSVNKFLPWTEIPRHYVAFATNNLWLVHSQIVAHEIVFGRKMIGCTFQVDPSSVLDQSKLFHNVVRGAIKEFKGA